MRHAHSSQNKRGSLGPVSRPAKRLPLDQIGTVAEAKTWADKMVRK